MRQHEHVTIADQAIEAHAFSFRQAGFTQFATHLIAARAYDRQPPTEPSYSELS
jgi:hypothetical protein